ncbi:MAG TPA: MSMEG_0567/Sll0786 family nitrogen starvation N-acetyltransferase [Actinomycetota bacterium]|nr:MSMEG_0567/Sll0786 family nitrogen starvation N-acetyltransferase [Actinomycetota bacterium]
MSRVAVVSPFSRPAEAEAALRRDLEVACVIAATAEELEIHHEIRRRVFVVEQGFFERSDRDEHDGDPATVHILGLYGPVAGGAVRIYPLSEPGLWKGDRLAVLPAFRRRGLGGPLVRFAVRTAAARGGHRMIAHIQPPNVRFFEHLGWERVGEPTEYVGRPHQLMAIDLRPFASG